MQESMEYETFQKTKPFSYKFDIINAIISESNFFCI